MKKQELIHLHGLLAEAANYYEEHEDTELDLTEYESFDTRPESIHKSKTDHKYAVFTLADEMTSAMEHDEKDQNGEDAFVNGGTADIAAEEADDEYVDVDVDQAQYLPFDNCPPGRVETAVDDLYDRHGAEPVNTILAGMYEDKPLDMLYQDWDPHKADDDFATVYSDVRSTLNDSPLTRDDQVNPMVWVYSLDADPNEVVSPRSYPPANSGYAAD